MDGKASSTDRTWSTGADYHRRRHARRHPLSLIVICAVVATFSIYACNLYIATVTRQAPSRIQRIPINAQAILKQCADLKVIPGPPADFHLRTRSDRFDEGTRPTLIKNAHVWTGARNGTETVVGDVLLSGGLVKGIGYIPRYMLDDLSDLVTIEADGAWVTPGLGEFYTHSIFSVYSADLDRSRPALSCWFAKRTGNGRYIRREFCTWAYSTMAEEYRRIQHPR